MLSLWKNKHWLVWVFVFFLANEYYNSPWKTLALSPKESKKQMATYLWGCMSCLFCNCLCPGDAWPCLSEHELAAEFSLAASYLHMLAGKLSRLFQAGGLACICTALVAQWQTLGVIVGVTHQNPQRHGRNPLVFSHKGKGAHLPSALILLYFYSPFILY